MSDDPHLKKIKLFISHWKPKQPWRFKYSSKLMQIQKDPLKTSIAAPRRTMMWNLINPFALHIKFWQCLIRMTPQWYFTKLSLTSDQLIQSINQSSLAITSSPYSSKPLDFTRIFKLSIYLWLNYISPTRPTWSHLSLPLLIKTSSSIWTTLSSLLLMVESVVSPPIWLMKASVTL